MKVVSRRGVLAASASVLVMAGLVPLSSAQAVNNVDINLVLVNDFQGQINEHTVQWAGTVQQLMGESPNSLLISAGDNVGTSTRPSSLQRDNPTIDVFNALGVDVSAVGNHEFDYGFDDLLNRIVPRANFPHLGANVHRRDGSSPLAASATFTVSDVKVAVIGAVTEETVDLVDPSLITDLDLSEPVAAVNAEVDRLNALPESQQPDVIVAAIHDGAPYGTWDLNQAKEMSAAFDAIVDDLSPDVDVISTGHTHNTYVFDAPVPGDPTRTRPVVESGYNGDKVGQVKLTVDADTGEVSAYTAHNVARVSTPEATLIASDPVLAEVAQIRDDAVAFVEEYDAAQISADSAEVDYETASATMQVATTDYGAAAVSMNAALAEYQVASQSLTSATAARDLATQAMNTAIAEYQAATEAMEASRLDYNEAKAQGTVASAEYTTALTASQKAMADYNAASAARAKAQADHDAASAAMAAALADYHAALAAAQSDAAQVAQTQYETAEAARTVAAADHAKAVADGEAAAVAYQEALDAMSAASAEYTASQAAAQAAGAAYSVALEDAKTAVADYNAGKISLLAAIDAQKAASTAGGIASAAYRVAQGLAQTAWTVYTTAQAAAQLAADAYQAAMAILGLVL